METKESVMSNNIKKGIVAGFAATVVLSVLMVMKNMMGLMPQLDPIAMMTMMMGASTPLVGWVGHFMIGAIFWGVLFASISGKLSGPYWLRGMIFGTGAWLLMMVMVMPMAGAGMFGLGLGIMAPMATLMLHWIFGAVLGGVYGISISRPPSPSVA
jgi:hypothetical protein